MYYDRYRSQNQQEQTSACVGETFTHRGATALYTASLKGLLAVVEALLAAGADKEAKTQHGPTALYTASRHGRLPVVQALLAAGAEKEAREEHGRTALHGADVITCYEELLAEHAVVGSVAVDSAVVDSGWDETVSLCLNYPGV